MSNQLESAAHQTDWLTIVLTAAATLIGGVLLLIFTESIRLFVIQPLKAYRDHVELILDRLDYHANYMTNFFSEKPDDEERGKIREIQGDLRSAATQLNAKYASISMKWLLIRLGWIPDKNDIAEMHGKLIFLSNNFPKVSRTDDKRDPIMKNDEAIEAIKSKLVK